MMGNLSHDCVRSQESRAGWVVENSSECAGLSIVSDDAHVVQPQEREASRETHPLAPVDEGVIPDEVKQVGGRLLEDREMQALPSTEWGLLEVLDATA